MEYFKKLSVKTPAQTVIDCPVRIQEIAILQDSFDKNILGRIKFLNQSKEKVIAVFFDLSAKDISGETVDLSNNSFIYQDMSVEPGELYGNKISIDLPNAVRMLSAEINRVVFEDGTVWKASGAETCQPLPLETVSLPKENVDQIREELTKVIPDVEHINYYYQENKSAWLCSCGKINTINNKVCSFCGCEKTAQEAYLTKEHFSSFCDIINTVIKVEKEKERAAAERKAEEKKQRQEEEEKEEKIKREAEQKRIAQEKRNVTIVVIIAIIAVTTICVIYNVRKNAAEMAQRSTYESAEKMMEDLQGFYSNFDNNHYTFIKIDGDILTRSYYKAYGARQEDKYDIRAWNFSRGTFSTSSDSKYIVLSDGNIEDPDGILFKKSKDSSIDDAENYG